MLKCARKPGIVVSPPPGFSAGRGGVHRFKAGPLLVLDIDGGGDDVEMLDPGFHVAAMMTPYASDAVVTGDQLAGQLLSPACKRATGPHWIWRTLRAIDALAPERGQWRRGAPCTVRAPGRRGGR